jgi:hypothetical protein
MSTPTRKEAIEARFAKWEARMQKLIGSIFRVPLTEDYCIYAQFLADESFAFYDSLTSKQEVNLAALTASPLLFRTHVMGLVHTQRAHKWERVGSYLIPVSLQAPGVYCRQSVSRQDADTQEMTYDYSLSIDGVEPVTITKEECETLEIDAVWHPLHIQERLRQYYKIQ